MHCYGNTVFTIKPWVTEGKDPRELANSYLIEYCNNLGTYTYLHPFFVRILFQ